MVYKYCIEFAPNIAMSFFKFKTHILAVTSYCTHLHRTKNELLTQTPPCDVIRFTENQSLRMCCAHILRNRTREIIYAHFQIYSCTSIHRFKQKNIFYFSLTRAKSFFSCIRLVRFEPRAKVFICHKRA